MNTPSRACPDSFPFFGHLPLSKADFIAGHTKSRAQRWRAQGKSIRSIAIALQMTDDQVSALLAPDGPEAA